MKSNKKEELKEDKKGLDFMPIKRLNEIQNP